MVMNLIKAERKTVGVDDGAEVDGDKNPHRLALQSCLQNVALEFKVLTFN